MRATIAMGAAALALAACAEGERVDPAAETGAPFRGPAVDLRGCDRRPEPRPEAPAPTPPPRPAPRPDAAPEPALDAPASAPSEADRRREIWLGSDFRCRAISSVRFRRCRFEETPNGHRLRFQASDVVCEDVRFDEGGDPAELLGCRSPWLVVPRRNRLVKAKRQDIWSGSHSGWRWKDGERYCCPGIWIEAPAALRDE